MGKVIRFKAIKELVSSEALIQCKDYYISLVNNDMALNNSGFAQEVIQAINNAKTVEEIQETFEHYKAMVITLFGKSGLGM